MATGALPLDYSVPRTLAYICMYLRMESKGTATLQQHWLLQRG